MVSERSIRGRRHHAYGPAVEERERILDAVAVELGVDLADAVSKMRRQHGVRQSHKRMAFRQRLALVDVECRDQPVRLQGVDERRFVDALKSNRLIAALDVYEREPLPKGHPLMGLPNTVLTPHLGYSVREVYTEFYRDCVENALAFLDGRPIRVMPPAAD